MQWLSLPEEKKENTEYQPLVISECHIPSDFTQQILTGQQKLPATKHGLYLTHCK